MQANCNLPPVPNPARDDIIIAKTITPKKPFPESL